MFFVCCRSWYLDIPYFSNISYLNSFLVSQLSSFFQPKQSWVNNSHKGYSRQKLYIKIEANFPSVQHRFLTLPQKLTITFVPFPKAQNTHPQCNVLKITEYPTLFSATEAAINGFGCIGYPGETSLTSSEYGYPCIPPKHASHVQHRHKPVHIIWAGCQGSLSSMVQQIERWT